MSANPIVHWELMGPNGEEQKNFYSTIFDWEFLTPEGFENYHMTQGDDMAVNGAIGQGSEETPAYSCIYVQVDDIEAKLTQIESIGGKTVLPRTELPEMVTFAMFNDPAGNLVGLVEATS